MTPPPQPRPPGEATAASGESDVELTRTRDGDDLVAEDEAPMSIGRYRIEGVLGSGGMGTVYRGFDPALRRAVAVKVIGGSRSRGPSARDRLVREAQALAAFSHPNVVAVYEVGTFEDAVFIAMELVEGVTLGHWSDDEEHHWEDIVEMYIRAGRGLERAHLKGIVHRDFKPANVLVGDDGRPRVLDFGLATADPDGTSIGGEEFDAVSFSERLTGHGHVMGTPAYMAPEQAAGRDVSPKSDQFSFAVALWEALTGVRPFPGGTMLEIQESIRSGRRRTGATRSSTSVASPAVLRILERALEAEPEDRWPDLGALLDALEDCLGRRRVWPWALAGLAGAGLLAGGLATLGGEEERCDGDAEWREAWDDDRRAALGGAYAGTSDGALERVEKALQDYGARWARLYEDTCRTQDSDPVFDRRIQCLRQRRDAARGSIKVLLDGDADTRAQGERIILKLAQPQECAEGDLEAPKHAVPRDPALAAEVSILREDLSAARALLVAGKPDEARDKATIIHVDATALGFAPLVNEAQMLRGLTHSRMGEAERAEEQLSLAFWGATDLGDDALAAEAAIELAWQVGYMQARYAEGVQWVRHFEAAQRRRGKDPADDASQVLGPIYFGWDKLDLALPHLRTALFSAIADGDPHGIGIAHLNLGALYYELGLPQLSRREFVAGREQLEAGRPASAADLVLLDVNHGGMELDLARDIETARPMIERAHREAIELLGPVHPTTALAYLKVGDLYSLSGNLEGAKKAYGRALEIAEQQKSPTDRLTIQSSLAVALHRGGELDESERLWRQIATEAQASLGPEHALNAAAQYGLGQLAEARGELEDARARYEDALSGLRENSRSDALSLRLSLTGVLGKLGRDEDALKLAEESLAWAIDTYGPATAQTLRAEVELAHARAPIDRDAAMRKLEALVEPEQPRHALRLARAFGWVRLGTLLRDDDPKRADQLLRDAEELLGPSLYPFERAALTAK